MTNREYCERLLNIRQAVNTLVNDLGATYSAAPVYLEKVLNDALNGQLWRTDGTAALNPEDKNTTKIISVVDFAEPYNAAKWASYEEYENRFEKI